MLLDRVRQIWLKGTGFVKDKDDVSVHPGSLKSYRELVYCLCLSTLEGPDCFVQSDHRPFTDRGDGTSRSPPQTPDESWKDPSIQTSMEGNIDGTGQSLLTNIHRKPPTPSRKDKFAIRKCHTENKRNPGDVGSFVNNTPDKHV